MSMTLGARAGALFLLAASLVVGTAACTAPMGDEDVGTSNDELRCVNAKAQKLATVAKRMDGRRSKHLCYRYVKSHLRAAGFSTRDVESKGYGGSAYLFASWAKRYPTALKQMGLAKADVSLNDLPRGAVIVWPRGMCGYSRKHGHIEVVVDDNSSRACSDFCGRIKKGCGKPDIYVPTGCVQSQPDEADDADDTSTREDDDDDATPGTDDADAGSDTSGGDTTTGGDDNAEPDVSSPCWSPTLGKSVEEFGCVQSRSNSVWFQCKEGLWYRGVEGDIGPYAPCASVHPLQ